MAAIPPNPLDECLWKIYAPGKGAGVRTLSLGGKELPMLAKLFTSPLFGPALRDVSPQRGQGKARVSLAWIDKRPVAAVTGVRRTEYGDLAVFSIHGFPTRNGGSDFRARCLLIQAKVAKEVKQIAAPHVPINPSNPKAGTSTAREYDLLTAWPQHDMYEYGSSGTPIASKLDVTDVTAWYMATPRDAPAAGAPAWRSPWMCAPAEPAAMCDVTLGELVSAFLQNTRVRRASTSTADTVGAAFALDLRALRSGTTPSSAGWDRVCMEILRGMRGFNLPRFLTGADEPGLRTIKLFANPIEPMYELAVRAWEYVRRRFGRSKMLVVIVSSYDAEG